MLMKLIEYFHFKLNPTNKYYKLSNGYKYCPSTGSIKKEMTTAYNITKYNSHSEYIKSLNIDNLGLLGTIKILNLSDDYFELVEKNDLNINEIKKIHRSYKLSVIADKIKRN
jgi:hypothetical protein